MKRILYIVIDLIIIYGSILLVFYLLDYTQVLIEYNKNFEAFVKLIPYIGLLYLLFMYVYKLYQAVHRSTADLVYLTLLLSISITIGIMGVCFFIRDIAFAFPRSVILYSAFLYFILLTIWHILLSTIQRKIAGVKKATIIGNDCAELYAAITSKLKNFYLIESQYTVAELSSESMLKEADTVFLSASIRKK